MNLIPEGKYVATVEGFSGGFQTKDKRQFVLPVVLKTGEYEIRVHLFGSLGMISLILDNKERFLSQKWNVRITHKTLDVGTDNERVSYIAERMRSK